MIDQQLFIIIIIIFHFTTLCICLNALSIVFSQKSPPPPLKILVTAPPKRGNY